MQTAHRNNPHMEPHGQRRQFDKVSTGSATCIPMQMANMAATGQNTNSLRSDCWNSPLCPRNMPANAQGLSQTTCGGGSSDNTTQSHKHTAERGSPATEVSIQSPANAMTTSSYNSTGESAVNRPEQGQHSMKRAKHSSSNTPDIKQDVSEEPSPMFSPSTADSTPRLSSVVPGGVSSSGKEKRLPHHVIERRYRENLNSQIEALRAAVPSTSACLTLDMEDIGSTNAASAIRPLSKAAVIAHAAEYMRQLSAQNEEVERMNRELRLTVEALRRLVNCEDCGVVQQIVDAGA